jgi:hypothetical protein
MAAKETTLKELGEMLAHVVKHMATKEDIANLAGQLTSVERELKSIRRDLDDLREKGRERHRLPERNRSRAGAHRRHRKAPRHQQKNRRLTDTIDYVFTDSEGVTSSSSARPQISGSMLHRSNCRGGLCRHLRQCPNFAPQAKA